MCKGPNKQRKARGDSQGDGGPSREEEEVLAREGERGKRGIEAAEVIVREALVSNAE